MDCHENCVLYHSFKVYGIPKNLKKEEKEELLYAQIDKEQIQNIRTANPVFENRRKDLYD